jgi:uncharacterized protein (DUF1810 family)
MNQIDKDFVYNRFPKTEHDMQLLETYRKDYLSGIVSYASQHSISEILRYFPVYEGTAGAEKDYPILTRYGFMALSIDPEFMDRILRPNCRALQNATLSADTFKGQELRLLRSSLIEFALLGCMETQALMSKLDSLFGEDDDYIETIVDERCSNLKRFLNAHEGAGRGVNEGDEVSSYEQALKEVKAGGKVTHWIWYIFPQMAGIKGTHSRPALFYGLNGRLEAFQYINHPTLRKHLVEICEAVLNNKYSVYEIFGDDVIKVRSCILLFASVCDIPVFKKLKSKYRW